MTIETISRLDGGENVTGFLFFRLDSWITQISNKAAASLRL